jgi:hypothetical protein
LAVVEEARACGVDVWQFLASDAIGPKMDFESVMILNVEIIVEDKIFHATSKFALHCFENRIIFSIEVRQKNNYFVITVKLLTIVFGVFLELDLASERNEHD